MGGGAKGAGLAKGALSRFPAWGVGDAARAFRVGLSNILDSKGREDISGSSPVKRTHGAGVAATLVGS